MKTYLGVFFGVLFSVTSLAAEVIVKIGEASPVTLTLQDLELLPHQTVTAKDHGGEEASWTGVPLYQVLQKAGLSLVDSLRGPVLAQYVLVTAADGYRAVFALPELDPRCTRPLSIGLAQRTPPLPLGAPSGENRSAEGSHSKSLGQQPLHHLAVDIGEAKFAALKAVGQLGVVHAEEVQDGGVKVVDGDRVLRHMPGEVVAFPIDLAALDSTACHPQGKRGGVVIASGDFLGPGPVFTQSRATKFTAPDHQGGI